MGTNDPTYNAKNQEQQGGAMLSIGGQLDIDKVAGGKLTVDGVDVTTAIATALAGVALGSKIAGGVAAFDGSNPTPIATGLATVVAFIATLVGAVAPGDNTSVLTANINGAAGNVDVYAWKNTGGTDPTLVASTGTESFYWLAIGT